MGAILIFTGRRSLDAAQASVTAKFGEEIVTVSVNCEDGALRALSFKTITITTVVLTTHTARCKRLRQALAGRKPKPALCPLLPF